jgi:hypothetical protein
VSYGHAILAKVVDVVAKSSIRNLDLEELEKVRDLLRKLDENHFPTHSEMEALRDILTSDEFKTLIEREKSRKLWAKVRLQGYRIVVIILGTVASLGAAASTIQVFLENFLWKR